MELLETLLTSLRSHCNLMAKSLGCPKAKPLHSAVTTRNQVLTSAVSLQHPYDSWERTMCGMASSRSQGRAGKAGFGANTENEIYINQQRFPHTA